MFLWKFKAVFSQLLLDASIDNIIPAIIAVQSASSSEVLNII